MPWRLLEEREPRMLGDERLDVVSATWQPLTPDTLHWPCFAVRRRFTQEEPQQVVLTGVVRGQSLMVSDSTLRQFEDERVRVSVALWTPAPASPQQWLPIGTVQPGTVDEGPKVLLYGPRSGITVGKAVKNEGESLRGFVGEGYHGSLVSWGVTHWMPLPPEPADRLGRAVPLADASPPRVAETEKNPEGNTQ